MEQFYELIVMLRVHDTFMTEYCGQLVSASAFYSEGLWFKLWYIHWWCWVFVKFIPTHPLKCWYYMI